MISGVACILLAAGASQRFGSAKMLYPISDDMPMLAVTIAKYRAVFEQVYVVTRSVDTQINDLVIEQRATVVDSPNAQAGMSQSIVAGVNATRPLNGWLIALGDMPYVESVTIQRLAVAIHANNIALPRAGGRVGNPVGFGVNYRDQLRGLQGDVGAKAVVRKVVRKSAEHVMYIDTDDLGIHQDIDLPNQV